MQLSSPKSNKKIIKSQKIIIQTQGEIPESLSYQGIKLANFIELELTDLSDSLINLNMNNQNFKNSIQETLSRSYNVFHQMLPLYEELNSEFLYFETKKLVKTYSHIFMKLIEKLELMQKKVFQKVQKQNYKTSLIFSRRDSKSSIRRMSALANQNQILSQSVQNDTMGQEGKQQAKNSLYGLNKFNQSRFRQSFNRIGGVSLYNENYSRHFDYNLDELKQFLQSKRKVESKVAQKEAKDEQDRAFKKSIMDELEDINYFTYDEQVMAEFYSKKRQIDSRLRNMSVGDELLKIAKFFRESENNALQFLKTSKSQGQFHHLTQGFNQAVQIHIKTKDDQIQMIKQKIEKLLKLLILKNNSLQKQLADKNSEIQKIKQQTILVKAKPNHVETQTHYNSEQEIKDLFRKVVQYQRMLEKQKSYFMKHLDDAKKQQDILINKVYSRDNLVKKLRQNLEEKNQSFLKAQKKVKYLVQSHKNMSKVDPYEYFVNLDRQTKQSVLKQAKEEGIFIGMMSDPAQRIKVRKTTTDKDKVISGMRFGKVYEQEQDEIMQSQSYLEPLKKNRNSFMNLSLSLKKKNKQYLSIDQPLSNIFQEKLNQTKKSQKNVSDNSISQQNNSQIQVKDYKSEKRTYKVIINGGNEIEEVIEKVQVFDRSQPHFISMTSKSSRSQMSKKQPSSFKDLEKKHNKIINDNILENSFNQKSGDVFNQFENTPDNKILGEDLSQLLKQVSNQKISQISQDHSNKYRNLSDHSNLDLLQQKSKTSLKDNKQRFSENLQTKYANQYLVNKTNEQKIQQFLPTSKKPILYDNNQMQSSKIKSNIKFQKVQSPEQNKKTLQKTNILDTIIKKHESIMHQDKILQTVSQKQKIQDNMFQNKHNKQLLQKNHNKSKENHKGFRNFENFNNNKIAKTNQTVYKNRDLSSKKQYYLNKTKHNQSSTNIFNDSNRCSTKKIIVTEGDQVLQKKCKKKFVQSSHNPKKNEEKSEHTFLDNLYSEFKDPKIIQAAKKSQNQNQFKRKVIMLHRQQCGNNCKHLQRFLRTFSSIKNKANTPSNKKMMKMHIENMNDQFQDSQSDQKNKTKQCESIPDKSRSIHKLPMIVYR